MSNPVVHFEILAPDGGALQQFAPDPADRCVTPSA